LEITKHSPEAVQLANAAACLVSDLSIDLAGGTESVSFLTDQPPVEKPAVQADITVDGHLVAIRCNASPIDAAALEKMGVVDFAKLPAALQQIMIVKAIDQDLDRLETWSGLPIGLDTGGNAKRELPVHLSFRLKGGARGDLFTTTGGASAIARIFRQLPQKPFDRAQLPINLGIEAGRTHLSTREIDQLDPGDVVIIESGPDLKNGKLELRPSPSLLIRATAEGTQLTIEEIMTVNPDETESGEGNGGAEAPLDVGALPVELVFELGRRQITVDELNAVQPGSTLELEHSVDDAIVVVRANGKTIAHGRLVDVGGKTGVQLS